MTAHKYKIYLQQILDDTKPSIQALRLIERRRKEIINIVRGDDERFLVIVGPCSAWPNTAVLEYAKRLAPLAQQYSDRLKIVMRVYTQKPRTAKGWEGVIVQPDPFKKPSVTRGARYVRSMMRSVVEHGLPIADELLFTHKAEIVGDLLSWAAIGARSSEDQEHRVFASGLSIPVGLKNPTSGNLNVAVNSVISAQSPHTYYAHGYEIATSGNPCSHLILRGSADGPNYTLKHVMKTVSLLKKAQITHPAILIDASHDNTMRHKTKDYRQQEHVVKTILRVRSSSSLYKKHVKGIMLESFLESGNQSLTTCTTDTVCRTGLSITDPCLGWDETATLLAYIHKHV